MKRIAISFIALIACMFVSCEDIVEDNIEDDLIVAIAPTAGNIIVGNSVTFSWNSLEGADDYRVQVQDEITNIIVIDSLVPGTVSLTHVLDPGTYNWRVRGENFGYQTAYTFPIDFEVQASSDLTNQLVSITSPSNDFYTNNVSSIILGWSGIAAADSYTFELVRTLTGSGSSIVNQTTGITSTTHAVNSTLFDVDASYELKVKALNSANATETVFSSVNLFYDRVVPNNQTLLTPLDNEIFSVNTAVDFTWNSGTDTGEIQSPITHTLQISTTSDFAAIVDSVSTTGNTASYTFQNTGIYYWRLSSTDTAGNNTVSSAFGIVDIQ